MSLKLLAKRFQEIEQELKAFGISSSSGSGNYMDTQGDIRFFAHQTTIADLKSYYETIQDAALIEAATQWEWYDRMYRMYFWDSDAHKAVHYLGNPKELAIYSMAELDDEDFSKKDLEWFLQEIGKQGFEPEIKRVRLKMTSNLSAANAELDVLMNKLSIWVDPSMQAVKKDLEVKIGALLETKLAPFRLMHQTGKMIE